MGDSTGSCGRAVNALWGRSGAEPLRLGHGLPLPAFFLQSLLVVLIWTLLVGASLAVVLTHVREIERSMALAQARGYFEQVKLTRKWNAGHGRVYVPLTADAPANPYLDVEQRELHTSENVTLTQINPAYMTRQLSELAAAGDGVHFRLTSLDPVRPANAPEPLERQYLERFAQGEGEQGEILGRGADREFFYMAPLYMEEGCLTCHEEHGYSLGDLRGAITIHVPMRESVAVGPPLATHSAMLLAGYGLIFLFFSRLRGDFDNVAFLAEHDGLTGLYNRATFDSALASEFARSSRGEAPLSLLMLDLDRFKAFNDHCGHLAGDGCLRRVAAAIRDSAQRPGDRVFRYGGEEFAVLLPNTSVDAARTVAERALAAVARAGCRWRDGDIEQVVTTSIGIAALCRRDSAPASLIARADAALYAAKRAGRNCYVLGTA